MSTESIGIFDSGFGGLTVMKAIRALLPHENIIYFGDTARLPYGTKSGETILRYSMENAAFLIEQGVKVLVVACHTACSYALDELQKKFDLPIIGVITPAIQEVAARCSPKRIGIIGTRGTIASGTYQSLIKQLLPEAEITAVPCQLLVHLVEEGFIEHPITEMAIEEYFRPLQNIDMLILGCTHFPLLQDQIQNALNPHVQVIDPAKFCAESLQQVLSHHQLLNPETTPPTIQFFVSDDPEKFRRLGEIFLDHSLNHVKNMNSFKKKREFFLYT